MKKIYTGNMRNFIIKDLEINEDKVRILEYEKPIVRKGLHFYRGFMGSFISLEYGTRLPDEIETKEYLEDIMRRRENKEAPYPDCSFVNDEDIEFSHEVCDSNFKAIKKYYKTLRREEYKARKKK